MITYKLLLKPDALSYKIQGIEVYELSIEFNISGSSKLIDTNILTNQEMIKKSDKMKYFLIKNKIYSLKEILTLQFLAKMKYIDAVIKEVWNIYGTSMSSIEVLDIVEDKLKTFERDLFFEDDSLDYLLISCFAKLPNNSNEKLDLVMLLRAFFYCQIGNGILLDFSNYDEHIPKLKELCLNNWIKKDKSDQLLDVLLDEIIEDYYDTLEF